MLFCPKVVLDPQVVKSFGESCKASLPIPYFSSLLHIYRQHDNQSEILKTLDQYNEKIEKSDLHAILSLSDDYRHEEEYGKALSILETASKDFNDSLSNDLLNLQKAKLYLAIQGQQNFPLSKEYINIILNHFSEGKTLLRFFPNNGTMFFNFSKHEVLCTKAVLDVCEGNFVAAYQNLKTADEILEYLNDGKESAQYIMGSASASSEEYSMEDGYSAFSYHYGEEEAHYIFEQFFTSGLIKAVETQIQHPDFPSELLYFIGEKVSHLLSNSSDLDYEDQRIFKKLVFKHQDVLRHILQCLHYHHIAISQEPTDGIEKLEKLLQL